MSADRLLMVLRHAKASGVPGVNDRERELTARGRRDAAAAGAWLLAEGLRPDHVVCSTAQRTKETWERVSAALGAAGGQAEVSYDRRVYDAGAGDLLGIVTEQPSEASTVLLVGHNPASHQLTVGLTGRSDLPFPTCALAVIRLPGGWDQATAGEGELEHFWYPKQLD